MPDRGIIRTINRLVRFILIWSLPILSGLYLGGGVIPPLFHSADSDKAEVLFSSLCGHICHQIPERSFFYDGVQLSLCSRCIGLYGAVFLTSLAVVISKGRLTIPLIVAAVLVLPGALDAIFDFTGVSPTGNFTRLALGVAAGSGFIAFIYPRYLRLLPR